jgi:predicted transcriptional regulator
MAGETTIQGASPRLVAKIIASYVSHHNLAPEQIPELIVSVHRSIAGLQRDAVICLDCGWKGKMLRRHLTTRHGLSGEDYLKRWGLPGDHPLTAPSYSVQRSNLAKELGLGRGGRGQGNGRRRRRG